MHEIKSGKWYSDADINEVLRYAGVRSAEGCSETIISDAIRAVEQVGEAALPKVISRECSLEIAGNVCCFDGLAFESQSLAQLPCVLLRVRDMPITAVTDFIGVI